jgi:hypothetical protein
MEDPGEVELSPGVVVHRRRLGTCSSCINLVKASFTTRIKAVCGTTVAGKISYASAKAAAAASLCTMGTNNRLGTPAKLTYSTCRCTCIANAECPSAVCSGGTCVDQKLASGQKCYDYDDADCVTGSCARGTYPSGVAVCCPSGGSEFANSNSDKYCDGQPTGVAVRLVHQRHVRERRVLGRPVFGEQDRGRTGVSRLLRRRRLRQQPVRARVVPDGEIRSAVSAATTRTATPKTKRTAPPRRAWATRANRSPTSCAPAECARRDCAWRTSLPPATRVPTTTTTIA